MATPLPRTPPSRDASPARVRGGAGCCGGGGGRSASPRRVPSEVVQECLRRCRERRQAREAAAQQATPSRTALRPDAQRCPATTPPRTPSPNVRWELGIHATGPVAVSAPASPQRRTRSADHGAGPLFSTPRSPLASPRAPSPGQRIPLPCGSCGGGGAQSPGRRPASAGGCGILDVSFLPGMASKPGCGSCPYGETTRKPKGPAQDPRSNLCYIGQQAHRMNPATFAGLLFNDVIPEQATSCEASCGNREGAFPPRARGMEVPQPAPPPGSAGSPGRGRSPQRGGSPAGARRLGSPARPAPPPRGVDLSGARGKRPCSSKCPSNKGGDSPARGSTAAGDAVPGAIFVHRLTPVSPHERSRSPVVQVEMPGRGLVHFTGDALMFGRAIALGGGAGGGQAGAGLPEPWASIVQRFHDTIATVIKQYGDLAESNDRADRLRNCQEDLSRLQNEVSMTMQNLQDGQAAPELAAVAARLQPLGQAARHLQEQCEGLLQLADAGERLPCPALRPPPDFPWSGCGGGGGGGGGGGATPLSVNVSVHSHRSSSETPCPAGGYGYRTPGTPCAERSQPSPAGAPVAAYVTREKHGGRSRTNVVVRFRPDEVAGPSSGGAGGGAEGVEPRSFLESLLRHLRERAGRSTGECDACAQQAQDLIGRLHAVTEIAKDAARSPTNASLAHNLELKLTQLMADLEQLRSASTCRCSDDPGTEGAEYADDDTLEENMPDTSFIDDVYANGVDLWDPRLKAAILMMANEVVRFTCAYCRASIMNGVDEYVLAHVDSLRRSGMRFLTVQDTLFIATRLVHVIERCNGNYICAGCTQTVGGRLRALREAWRAVDPRLRTLPCGCLRCAGNARSLLDAVAARVGARWLVCGRPTQGDDEEAKQVYESARALAADARCETCGNVPCDMVCAMLDVVRNKMDEAQCFADEASDGHRCTGECRIRDSYDMHNLLRVLWAGDPPTNCKEVLIMYERAVLSKVCGRCREGILRGVQTLSTELLAAQALCDVGAEGWLRALMQASVAAHDAYTPRLGCAACRAPLAEAAECLALDLRLCLLRRVFATAFRGRVRLGLVGESALRGVCPGEDAGAGAGGGAAHGARAGRGCEACRRDLQQYADLLRALAAPGDLLRLHAPALDTNCVHCKRWINDYLADLLNTADQLKGKETPAPTASETSYSSTSQVQTIPSSTTATPCASAISQPPCTEKASTTSAGAGARVRRPRVMRTRLVMSAARAAQLARELEATVLELQQAQTSPRDSAASFVQAEDDLHEESFEALLQRLTQEHRRLAAALHALGGPPPPEIQSISPPCRPQVSPFTAPAAPAPAQPSPSPSLDTSADYVGRGPAPTSTVPLSPARWDRLPSPVCEQSGSSLEPSPCRGLTPEFEVGPTTLLASPQKVQSPSPPPQAPPSPLPPPPPCVGPMQQGPAPAADRRRPYSWPGARLPFPDRRGIPWSPMSAEVHMPCAQPTRAAVCQATRSAAPRSRRR